MQKRWIRIGAIVVGTIIIMYLMIYIDVIMRAKESYKEAELAKSKNDWKMAYVWYQTVVELFSPPESKWVLRARFLSPVAKEKWRDDLRKRKVSFEEYMLDEEPGQKPGMVTAYTTKKKKLLERILSKLKTENIQVDVFDERTRKIPNGAYRIFVNEKDFWKVSNIVKTEIGLKEK